MSTPGQSNQYRGEGFVVYFEGSENDKAWYETKGNSSEMETPNARPFFTSEGAMIPHARIAPPTSKNQATGSGSERRNDDIQGRTETPTCVETAKHTGTEEGRSD